ncbi:Polyamine transporter 3 [Lecanosticta acicola]|uniref:Polyamine transporter 3 n=1 Tax=Lecanosticta acicola TaxID=111012 RepID=A0AAI9E800_9PEZI|nr:Polyamine transporter 3 [Lecanosticta acicola]
MATSKAEDHPPVIAEVSQGLRGREDAGTVITGENTSSKAELEDDLTRADPARQTSSSSSKSSTSCPSAHDENVAATQEEAYTLVSFSRGDPENPYNWSQKKKTYVLLTCIALVMNSTIGSALPSGASEETAAHFDITNQSLLVLPVSIFLVGYVLGPLVFAPMSESFGRKWVVMGTFITFTAFNLGCALTPTFAGLIIMRLLVGISASTPISVIGGIYADIYGTPKARGRAVTAFMAATTWGPLIGPIISGFVATVSWRWTYWVALIIAGATWPFLIFLPETYGPVLLRRRAERLRAASGDVRVVAPVEMEEKQSWAEFCTVVLTRPVRMFLFEWIVLFSCLYLSVAYAIFYIYFQAYPIIFQGTYGFTAGEEGLTFLPIGVGAVFAGGIYLYWEHYLDKARNRPCPPAWAQKEEYVRLPIACLGAPLFAISLFWLGWTAKPEIHWIVPTLSALPFGIGFLLIFMALINYIVDAYEVFAASAMGAASCSRSIFGVVLPFAARPMYETLGIGWACSLFGFVSIAMGIVPFFFIRYGEQIRANSKWCQELKRQKGEREEERERRQMEGREPEAEGRTGGHHPRVHGDGDGDGEKQV